MNLVLKSVLLAAVLALTASPAQADGHGAPPPGCLDGCAPGWKKACCPEPEVKKVKKTCWEIECKEVCIPRVRFPWEKCQDGCEPARCGKVRTVRILKLKTYEVEECGTKWTIGLVPDCGQPCGHGR